MRLLLALAVAFLLVTAGCSGFSGTHDTDTDTTVAPHLQDTPTPTEAPTTTPVSESSLPPGVTPGADDAVDERAVYVAHDRALENRSVTWRQQQLWTNNSGTVLRWGTLTVWTNGSQQRYETETGGAHPTAVQRSGLLEYDFWTNGSATVSQQTLLNGSIERRISDGGPPGSFAHVGAGRIVLESVLTGNDLHYVGVEHRNGTALHILAGTPDDSRLTMRVTPDGVVRSFVLRTDIHVNETEVTIVRRFHTYDVGMTTVEKPEWAVNTTGQ